MIGRKLLWGVLGFVVMAAVPLRDSWALSTDTPAREAVIIDYESGRVLFEKNADTRMPTASMSKLMTMYMVFDAIKQGRLSMNDELSVSQKAWKMGGSRMYLDLGTRVKVSDLVRGVAVQSGNDATVVFAEALSGDEDTFSRQMTERAHELGMKNSNFKNASGWPDPDHYSTVRDLAILARHLIQNFPEFYPIYGETSFTYNNINQGNRNPLLYRNMGVDGLKTGHTEEAGYGLVASGIRGGHRLVLVVSGLKNMQQRADESARLIDWGFANFDSYEVAKKDVKLGEVSVWLGDRGAVPVGIKDDVSVTLASDERRAMKAWLDVKEPVAAPITTGQQVGELVVEAPGVGTRRYPVVALENSGELGFWGRVQAGVETMLMGSSPNAKTQTAEIPTETPAK
jgi:D-alanyl-D-alanine carboxypeptidase (penicillin-binding protein 5/6)